MKFVPDTSWFKTLDIEVVEALDGVDRCLASDPGSRRTWHALLARDTAAAERLKRDFSVTCELGHDWALVPLALIPAERGTALVFPEAMGQALDAVIKPGHRAALSDFLDIAVGAASALAKLHALGIVHCDIRPANLFLDAAGTVRLAGFGAAQIIGGTGQAPATALPAGTFVHVAPEQARRHDPYCDHRSDLYALGVVLYELATGEPPLKAASTQQWLHAHVAVEAIRPSLLHDAVPNVVDEIILKLIAKDPADRYQSATALHADLLRCRDDWSAIQAIEPFELGRADVSAKGTAPRHLCGRSAELGLLLDAHSRVAGSGSTEIVLLSGAPGAGKSALVERFSQAIGPSGTRFASGKSDLMQKAMPYAPLVQIIRSLTTRLLSESDDALTLVKQRLVDTLAGHVPLLIDLVPETEIVLGPAAPLPAAPATLAQTRMRRVILRTLAAFATRGRPLVLFLDDLQWADDQTLAVISALVEDTPEDLVLIGAYRDEESRQPGRLDEVLSAIRLAGLPQTNIAVGPLAAADVARLLGGILNGSEADIDTLAETVHHKTSGNPFHCIQLLQQLIKDRVVTYDAHRRRWVWDTARITYEDSVVDFMLRRLDALAPAQRELLRGLACVDGQCDEMLLARMSGEGPRGLEELSAPLIDTGLLARREIGYAIAHDRVLEAAYALTNPADRPREHARIARLMVDLYGETNADVLFELASQIERAAGDEITATERLTFVRVLLAAARRAMNAAAVERAVGYLQTARSWLDPTCAAEHPALVFEVEFLNCECLVAGGSIEQASRAVGPLLAVAASPVDRADAYRLKATIHTVRSDYEAAIEAALNGLRLLGIELARWPASDELDAAYAMVRQGLSDCPLESFADLPELKDRTIQSALALLSSLSSSFFVEGGLKFLHTAKIVELTLQHGTSPAAGYGLAWFGVFSASLYGAYEDGFAHASAAAALVQRDGYEAQRTAVLIALDQVSPWTQPLHYALARARDAVTAGHAAGDIGMTCYARNHIASDLIALGAPLAQVREAVEDGIAVTQKISFTDVELILRAQLSFVDALQNGQASEPRPIYRDQIRSYTTLFFASYYEGLTAFLLGSDADAERLLREAMAVSWSAPAHIDLAYCHLFSALAAARVACDGRHPEAVENLARHHAMFSRWADLNPTTFRCKLLLIEAEIARMKGDLRTALGCYERSALGAQAAGFVHEEALAYELAGAFCLQQGLSRSAESHIRASHACYRRWGAEAKARRLEADHPQLFKAPSEGTGATPDAGQVELNLAVIMKAAQAVSQEILLDRVVETLMTDMIIHTGAQTGLLLLMREGELVVAARARVIRSDVEVELDSSTPTAEEIPGPVLNTVVRTKRALVLADADAEASRVRSEWPNDRRIRSVICQPLVKSGNLVGILYLENNLAPGVFTDSRMAMLDILAPQAAISLDAARLYRELGEENTRRARAEAALHQARADLARATQLTVIGELAASIAHEVNQPLTTIASYAEAGMRWLTRPAPDLAEAMAALESIRSGAMRAGGIVKALRSLAKQTTATPSPIDLNGLIRDVLRLAATDFEVHQVRLTTDLEPDGIAVLGDAVQLQQVVLNLVINAIDAMAGLPDDRRHLSVRSTRAHGSIRVHIEDNGDGISPEILERIFDPLFTTKTTGMGMGLAICRSIVQAHNGALDAVSAVGRGSTFSFQLPALDP
ncbi:trifunctional serine/threonine-protein kinase/ATP-binding protein/sensor histidine kinase [Inquilinus sp. OTU3971]|uniref:trifunctional serine/threonine-protein kinase/ATP-binding protein/sensor histidine kinase n=1 Tax=Inquilinus sp. OTU3971 TaxID=3043855 RepID=UPI00313E2F56